MTKILTLEEAREKAIDFYSYDNGDYWYKLKGDRFYHLIRNGVDLLEGKDAIDCHLLTLEEAREKAIYCYSYDNGDYWYKLKGDRFWHLIRNGVDVLEGKDAINCYSYTNGDYEYETENGVYHLIRNGVDLLVGRNAIYCYSYDNGDYEYHVHLLEGKRAVYLCSFDNGHCKYEIEDGVMHEVKLKRCKMMKVKDVSK